MAIDYRTQDARLTSHISHLALPFLLFSVSLTVLLVFSSVVVLPRFTRFDASGRTLSASALVTYREELERKIDDAQAKRDVLLLPAHDDAYLALKRERQGRLAVDAIRGEILRAMEESTDDGDSIVLKNMRISTEEGTVHLDGDVRAGLRSMTVLARFVERLRQSFIVASLTPPAFVREEGPEGQHSPFSFEITIRSSDVAP